MNQLSQSQPTFYKIYEGHFVMGTVVFALIGGLAAILGFIVVWEFIIASVGQVFGFVSMTDHCGGGGSGSSCSGGSSGSGCSGSCGTCGSTPFLAALDKNGKQRIFNDVLISTPSTLFVNRSHGEQMYRSGQVGFDLYPIPLNELRVRDGHFELALKEIEPEQSFVHEFQYGYINVPDKGMLVTAGSHQELFSVISPEQPIVGSVTHSSGNVVGEQLKANIGRSRDSQKEYIENAVLLREGETLYFSVSESEHATHLSLGAFWREPLSREYYIDRIRELEAQSATLGSPEKTIRSYMRKTAASLVALAAAVLPVSGGGIVNDSSLVKTAFTPPQAHASTPGRSLYVYYRDRDGSWVQFSIIHPRHLLTLNTLVDIPSDAYMDGFANIKVEATKDHYIYSLGTVSNVSPIDTPVMYPVSGLLNNTKPVTASDSAPLETYAGDMFSFLVPVPEESATHVVFRLHGYYVPLPTMSDEEMSQWWTNLSQEDKALYVG